MKWICSLYSFKFSGSSLEWISNIQPATVCIIESKYGFQVLSPSGLHVMSSSISVWAIECCAMNEESEEMKS
ncbi:unnamed protein product [Larinioides sclopetarius]|uniref:Uncharacterized protein n=1 Tax=Larinioides sclopetarius TaxID=280406 RepID=A0AAV1ZEP9_9ARAC